MSGHDFRIYTAVLLVPTLLFGTIGLVDSSVSTEAKVVIGLVIGLLFGLTAKE